MAEELPAAVVLVMRDESGPSPPKITFLFEITARFCGSSNGHPLMIARRLPALCVRRETSPAEPTAAPGSPALS
jgi:hypothetical protein